MQEVIRDSFPKKQFGTNNLSIDKSTGKAGQGIRQGNQAQESARHGFSIPCLVTIIIAYLPDNDMWQNVICGGELWVKLLENKPLH